MNVPNEHLERPLHQRVTAIRGYRRPSEAPRASREILMNASPRIRALLTNEIALMASRDSKSNTAIASFAESSQHAGMQVEHVNYSGFRFPSYDHPNTSLSNSNVDRQELTAEVVNQATDSGESLPHREYFIPAKHNTCYHWEFHPDGYRYKAEEYLYAREKSTSMGEAKERVEADRVPAGTKRNVDSPLAAYSTLRESKSANLDLNSPSQMQPSPVLTTSTGAYVIPVRRTTQTSQKLQEAMDSVIQALRDKRDISEQLVANLLSSVENLLSLSKEIVQYCYYTEAISKTSAIFRVIIAMHEMVGQHCVIKDEIDEIFWCLGVYKTDIGEPNK